MPKSDCMMSSDLVGITADDLTGAADTAAAFAGRRGAVGVSLGRWFRGSISAPAFAVTTDSRACAPDQAYELAAESAYGLLKAGASLVYKKVDSNLRGNVGAEIAAVRAAVGRPVLFAPAFPARGRTTVGGVALIDNVPVAETEMAVDPEAPVRDSAVEHVIRSQSAHLSVLNCSLSETRAGGAEIADRLCKCDVLVADAETEGDLTLIAGAALALCPRPVVAGSAGLARALATRLLGPAARAHLAGTPRGPVLAILASSSGRLVEQVDRVSQQPGLAPVPLLCERLSRADDPVPELAGAIARARGELQAGRNAVVYATGPLPDAERPVELVVEHLAHLAFVLVKLTSPAGLLVGGGATAHAVLAALNADAVDVDDEPLPGTAAGLVVGGHFAGRPVVLKPGVAGDESAVVALLDYLGLRAGAER